MSGTLGRMSKVYFFSVAEYLRVSEEHCNGKVS